ncbi:IS1634 family transposase [Ectothiorhodospiraceae bacterium BW-2]|nr:IS1634 family transposase [Ectothiorhodospiraceae bacterium BW-2]
MTTSIESTTQSVDAMPIIKHYMDKLEIPALLNKYVPNNTGADIAPAQVLSLLVMNLLNAPTPLYQIPQWLGKYVDGLGEDIDIANKYNDDRSARALTRLYDADRDNLLVELTANAIRVWRLEYACIQNDTTSITLIGAYDTPYPHAALPLHGHNKDFRPDCKQLVFGLNTTTDGYVPLSYRLYDGNQADIATHQTNWQQLREQLGKSDFIYVADSKLCSQANLDVIASAGGQFITVMSRNIKVAKQFTQAVEEGFEPKWDAEWSKPNPRKKGSEHHYELHEAAEQWQGYRVIWVRSSSKAATQSKQRHHDITTACANLTALQPKLNRYHLKSRQQIEAAIKEAAGSAAIYLDIQLTEQCQTVSVKIGRGRPGADSEYQQQEVISYQLSWQIKQSDIDKKARSDGLFPLLTNTDLPPLEVLQTYKKQPHLEKRFLAGKSVLEIAPVFLKDTRRIEAMMLLIFIALMILSLVERAIRKAMDEQAITALPIRPSGLKTKAPTWRVIRQFFTDINLTHIRQNGVIIHRELKGLSALHQQVLRLIDVPLAVYQQLQRSWWVFVEP